MIFNYTESSCWKVIVHFKGKVSGKSYGTFSERELKEVNES